MAFSYLNWDKVGTYSVTNKEVNMNQKDTGVFQLNNGYWGYRYAIKIDGKSKESKK